MYKIIRFYSKVDPQNPSGHLLTKRRTMDTGLTLKEAQAHCKDPATSTGNNGTARKRKGWDWFDGYENN